MKPRNPLARFLVLGVLLSMACAGSKQSQDSDGSNSDGTGASSAAEGGTSPGGPGSGGRNAGGTSQGGVNPGGANRAGVGGRTQPLGPPTSAVVFSEIQYHPAEERSLEDEHEFLELHNTGNTDASLAGWKLRIGKTERLTFPEGTTIAAGGYLVLAKNRERLLGVSKYQLSPALVIGDYAGGLDNGDDTVSLLDPNGILKDSVAYQDQAPWPIGADALGAQEAWLPELAPYDQHQYMGRSLERYSPQIASNDPRNWEASPVDGATPGRANSISGEPPAIVLRVAALSESKQSLAIAASDRVRITAELSEGSVSDVVVEYRLDPIEKIGASTQTAPMTLAPGTSATYEATLPPAAANTVVRYRILATRDGSPGQRVGPRTTDPRAFYAYFVAPPQVSGRTYRLFITPENWSTMWDNLRGGADSECAQSATWDATLPAVLVHESKVYDVQVRYHGSLNRRTDGIPLPSWSAPGPTAPSPPMVLSWRVKFPRYDKLEGWGGITLNKLKHGCPGVLHALEGALMEAAGVPSQRFRFARFYINGAYYAYTMEVHNLGEEILEPLEEDGRPVGDLFKSDGNRSETTLRGPGDFTPLAPICNLPAEARYRATYERQTHEWKDRAPGGHQMLIELIEELDRIQAVTDADPRVREYLNKYFDVPRLISQYAVRNWVGVWDDGVHNFLPYKRSTDSKWLILPQDFDCDFGGDRTDCGTAPAPVLSFFHPESGRGLTWGSPSRLKVQLIKAHRADFAARVQALGSTLFTEQNIEKLLTEILAGFDRAAWQQAPVRACDLDRRVDLAKQWLAERRAFLALGIQ